VGKNMVPDEGEKKTDFVPLLFGKYDFREVKVTDRGLQKYINLTPIIVPHTDAKFANRPFGKTKLNFVERLMDAMMHTGAFTGKKSKSYAVVKAAFEIIEKKEKKNPIQVLVDAVQNAAPREETTRLIFGGISVPKSVDVAPARRVDIAFRNICVGAITASRKNRKRIEVLLATEIMLAAKGDINSFAIAKKDEIERIAVSAR
jgi:small subunit ribosomal protein S7